MGCAVSIAADPCRSVKRHIADLQLSVTQPSKVGLKGKPPDGPSPQPASSNPQGTANAAKSLPVGDLFWNKVAMPAHIKEEKEKRGVYVPGKASVHMSPRGGELSPGAIGKTSIFARRGSAPGQGKRAGGKPRTDPRAVGRLTSGESTITSPKQVMPTWDGAAQDEETTKAQPALEDTNTVGSIRGSDSSDGSHSPRSRRPSEADLAPELCDAEDRPSQAEAGAALVRQMRVSIMGDPTKSRPGASLALTHLPRRAKNEVPLLRGAIANMNTYAMVDARISEVELLLSETRVRVDFEREALRKQVGSLKEKIQASLEEFSALLGDPSKVMVAFEEMLTSSEAELIERGEMDLKYRHAMEIHNSLMEAIELAESTKNFETRHLELAKLSLRQTSLNIKLLNERLAARDGMIRGAFNQRMIKLMQDNAENVDWDQGWDGVEDIIREVIRMLSTTLGPDTSVYVTRQVAASSPEHGLEMEFFAQEGPRADKLLEGVRVPRKLGVVSSRVFEQMEVVRIEEVECDSEVLLMSEWVDSMAHSDKHIGTHRSMHVEELRRHAQSTGSSLMLTRNMSARARSSKSRSNRSMLSGIDSNSSPDVSPSRSTSRARSASKKSLKVVVTPPPRTILPTPADVPPAAATATSKSPSSPTQRSRSGKKAHFLEDLVNDKDHTRTDESKPEAGYAYSESSSLSPPPSRNSSTPRFKALRPAPKLRLRPHDPFSKVSSGMFVAVPVCVGGVCAAALCVDTLHRERVWSRINDNAMALIMDTAKVLERLLTASRARGGTLHPTHAASPEVSAEDILLTGLDRQVEQKRTQLSTLHANLMKPKTQASFKELKAMRIPHPTLVKCWLAALHLLDIPTSDSAIKSWAEMMVPSRLADQGHILEIWKRTMKAVCSDPSNDAPDDLVEQMVRHMENLFHVQSIDIAKEMQCRKLLAHALQGLTSEMVQEISVYTSHVFEWVDLRMESGRILQEKRLCSLKRERARRSSATEPGPELEVKDEHISQYINEHIREQRKLEEFDCFANSRRKRASSAFRVRAQAPTKKLQFRPTVAPKKPKPRRRRYQSVCQLPSVVEAAKLRSRTMLQSRTHTMDSHLQYTSGASTGILRSHSSSVFDREEGLELAMRPMERRTSVSHDLFLWVCTPRESRSSMREPVEMPGLDQALVRTQAARIFSEDEPGQHHDPATSPSATQALQVTEDDPGARHDAEQTPQSTAIPYEPRHLVPAVESSHIPSPSAIPSLQTIGATDPPVADHIAVEPLPDTTHAAPGESGAMNPPLSLETGNVAPGDGALSQPDMPSRDIYAPKMYVTGSETTTIVDQAPPAGTTSSGEPNSIATGIAAELITDQTTGNALAQSDVPDAHLSGMDLTDTTMDAGVAEVLSTSATSSSWLQQMMSDKDMPTLDLFDSLTARDQLILQDQNATDGLSLTANEPSAENATTSVMPAYHDEHSQHPAEDVAACVDVGFVEEGTAGVSNNLIPQEAPLVNLDPSAGFGHSVDATADVYTGVNVYQANEMESSAATNEIDMTANTLLNSSSAQAQAVHEDGAEARSDLRSAPIDFSEVERANTGPVESGDAGNGTELVDGTL